MMFPFVSWRRCDFGFVAILMVTFFPGRLNADFIPPYDVPTGFLQPFNLSDGSLTSVGSWTLHESGTPLAYAKSFIETNP